MSAANVSQATLSGENAAYAQAVQSLQATYGFDFVALGFAAFLGAPLKWVYSAGATSERHRRIVLAPGHGIGGIVLKTGKPMVFTDIDNELDPREYSSYPIVFAEDLRSLCALPVQKEGRVIGVLLCAFRTQNASHVDVYHQLAAALNGSFCDLGVITDDFLDFAWAEAMKADDPGRANVVRGGLSQTITAQEEERRRISREIHDGVAQELLTASFSLRRLQNHTDKKGKEILEEGLHEIDAVLEELHNISVMLRPSSLDLLGFMAALRSQAAVLEKTYGCRVLVAGDIEGERFDPAMETQSYRICQEAMTNACKYSGADEVRVSVEEAGGSLHVSVRDTGCGFDVANPQIKGSGCGLFGMRERAQLIGAALTIESDNNGTCITLVAPMYRQDPHSTETEAE